MPISIIVEALDAASAESSNYSNYFEPLRTIQSLNRKWRSQQAERLNVFLTFMARENAIRPRSAHRQSTALLSAFH